MGLFGACKTLLSVRVYFKEAVKRYKLKAKMLPGGHLKNQLMLYAEGQPSLKELNIKYGTTRLLKEASEDKF